ncbi:hypothetical protein [Methyloraptor flagellatus]|uniref:Uncharacterized protein n=1 Tax=Methyloraptor flagellatus TaxID=3162530 RepID=A0AAU7X6Y2_9HYPH
MSHERKAAIAAMVSYLKDEAIQEHMGFTAYCLAMAEADLRGPVPPGTRPDDVPSVKDEARMLEQLIERCTEARRAVV